MCAKNSHVKKKKKPSSSTRKRARPKTRKLKYLSLKLELSNQTQIQNQTQKQKQKQPTKSVTKKKQLNLFPLRPENLLQDNKDLLQDDQNVAFLFETATDDTSTTLQGLLSSTTTTTTVSEEEKVPELPFNDEESSLVRSAMRGCKQRDASEERYVSYWEVVEKREQADDVSSCSSGGVDSLMMRFRDCKKKSLVGLKLDYEEVLNAWSNKGPLYLPGDLNPPQTVPQLNDPATKALLDGWDNLWTVPEMEDTKTKKEKEGETKEAILKSEQREASVLRYKEKRRNRLFSKRIRYEVRKLNAEKRPRVKGRFVKRDEDE